MSLPTKMAIAATAATFGACFAAAMLGATAASAQTVTAPSCRLPQSGGVIFWFDVLEVKPGQHVSLQALWTDRPDHFEPTPAACVKSLIVAPRAIVSLSSDGAAMDVAPNAKDGSLINVAAVVGGQSVMAHARVVDPSAHPLMGVWRERPGPCQALPGGAEASPIGELAFTSSTFALTWQPFEAYHDYTGSYQFDPQTGALTLTATGGAILTAAIRLAGHARFTQPGRLEISGMDFGAPRGGKAHQAGCPIIFEK